MDKLVDNFATVAFYKGYISSCGMFTCLGEKFYRFLRNFSTHVLEETLKKNAPG